MANEERPIASRIGITLLNLFAPGLGLLRVSGQSAAFAFLGSPILILLVLWLAGKFLARPNFEAFVIVVATTAFASLAILAITIIRTWRESRWRAAATGWARWYGICAAAFLTSLGMNQAVDALHSVYRSFSIPADGMVPTLSKHDLLFADMHGGRHARRGDIILFEMPPLHTAYIKRVVALPHDRIAIRRGVPIINGRAVAQTLVDIIRWNGQPARRVRETLPSEAGSHEILDLGDGTIDDMPERIVPAEGLFVLGDNRDRSADSRLARANGGIGWVRIADVIATPLFIYWSNDRRTIGKTFSR